MGNDMFNDEQLAYAEIVQKVTEDALGFWKDRALKAEAKLADKYLIEEQYEAACGDRDGLLRMVETLREQKDKLEAERDALLSKAAPPASRPMTRDEADAVEGIESAMFAAPPADAATEAVREARKALAYRGDMETRAKWLSTALRSLLAALSTPAPAQKAREEGK